MMKQGGQKGFTLIETVVAIVVAGLLGLMIFMFAKAGVESAPTPWLRFDTMGKLRQVMENVTADYTRFPASTDVWSGSTVYALGNRISAAAVGYSPYAYECVQAGQSGTVEPAWPSEPTYGTITDGAVEWQYFLVAIQTKITKKSYGQYDIVDNKFVRKKLPETDPAEFEDSTGVTLTEDDYLKVTLEKETGTVDNVPIKVMTLFSKSY